MPDPLASCPVIKAGSYVILEQKRQKWVELIGNFVSFKQTMLDPVYAEYVANAPADDFTQCRQRVQDALSSGAGWMTHYDTRFCGDPAPSDTGTFGNTKKLIDELDCSLPQAQWMNHAANVAAALDQMEADLQTAQYELIGLQSVFNMVYQDCPVPRPQG